MRVVKTMRPGDRATSRFQRCYGERPCAVRYRKSACGTHIMTPVEIIVDERARVPAGVSHNTVHARQRAEPIALQIAHHETELRKLVKQAGRRVYRYRYELRDRMNLYMDTFARMGIQKSGTGHGAQMCSFNMLGC